MAARRAHLQSNPPRARGPIACVRIFFGLIAYHLTSWGLSHPYPLRPLFALLRRIRPVAMVGDTVLLAHGADAREALSRFEDFTLGEVLSPRMPWGPFLLTIDWRDQHDRERALLESMVARDADVAHIRAVTADVCAKALANAAQISNDRRRIDVVRELCEPVVVAIADRYFGIPVVRADTVHTARILREVAGIAMVQPPEGSKRDIRAKRAIAELTQHIEKTIESEVARAHSAPLGPADPSKTLLERLVVASRATNKPAWLDDDFVRRYVTGLAATGGATIVRATTNALYELLRRPKALASALRAVEALDGPGGNTGTAADPVARRNALRRIVYEALRFRPMLPLLLRYVPRDTLIAKGTERQRLIKGGSSVIAAPMAVMFDPAEFKKPGEFKTDRELKNYVHFGFGPRKCFGKYVADTAMVEIVRCLLKMDDLALGEGWSGTINYDGPVADSLTVTFRAFRSSASVGGGERRGA